MQAWIPRAGGTSEGGGTPNGVAKREGCADMCGADACELHHWGLRWNPILGHETLCCRGEAGEQHHWGLQWSSPWGHETLYWAGGAHANCAGGARGDASWGHEPTFALFWPAEGRAGGRDERMHQIQPSTRHRTRSLPSYRAVWTRRSE